MKILITENKVFDTIYKYIDKYFIRQYNLTSLIKKNR